LERRQEEEEEKEIQVQLQYAQRMETFETLAYGIAHTFNNLFMAIIGNTSVMLLNTHPTDPHYEKLRAIERAIDRGSAVTDQLLAYAKKGHYDLINLNLNQVVRETSESFGMSRKNITIHRELAEDPLEVRADQAQIEQVLRNLYVNAADAMPGGGDLFLKTMNVTRKAGEYVLVAVRDTGGGMDKEIAGRIFDPFFTTKALGIGTGLGLAWAYGTIKAHSGYIDVDSQKGVGTTFTVYLPAFGKRV
jgi:signal transduction histidine kinase